MRRTTSCTRSPTPASLAHAACWFPRPNRLSCPSFRQTNLLFLDLETKGISESGRHPLDAHRARLRDLGCVPLSGLRHGREAWTAGLVVTKQRPPTAKGFAFFVLEDASTRVQAIISPDLW